MTTNVAVAYARVSTIEQAHHNLSLPDQVNHIRGYAERNGIQIISEYEEPGASARDDKRPIFTQMMDRALSNPPEFDTILVHSMSRFFRDELLCEFYYRKLKKNGVRLISVTQAFGEGSTGDLTRRIMALIDEMNSVENAKHVHRTMLENARQGFHNGSKAPIGYSAVVAEIRGDKMKKRLEIEPVGAEIVRLIFRLYLEGDGVDGPLGTKNIAVFLGQHGHIAPSGRRFSNGYVYTILKDEIYAGRAKYNVRDGKTNVVRPKEEWIEFAVPPIVTEEEFQKVQELMLLRSPTVTAPRLVNSPVLLTGIARCGGCGTPMARTTGKGGHYAYYRCALIVRTGVCEGGAASAINTDALDAEVISRVTNLLLTPERVQLIVAEVAAEREAGLEGVAISLQQLRTEHGKTMKKLGRLMHALADGTVESSATFKATVVQTEADASRLTSLIAAKERTMSSRIDSITLEQASRFAHAFREKLLSGSPASRKRILRSFVKEVIVSENEIVIVGGKSDLAGIVTGGKKNDQGSRRALSAHF